MECLLPAETCLLSCPRLAGKVRVIMASDLANPRLAGKKPNYGGPWLVVTAFMRTLQAVHGTAPDPSCGEFDVEAVAEDGTGRRGAARIRDQNPVRGHAPGPPDQGPGGATEPAGPMVVGVRWRSYRFCLMFQLSWLQTAVAHQPGVGLPWCS